LPSIPEQTPDVVDPLLEPGADVNAVTGDGSLNGARTSLDMARTPKFGTC
jgi:hypothetical protein